VVRGWRVPRGLIFENAGPLRDCRRAAWFWPWRSLPLPTAMRVCACRTFWYNLRVRAIDCIRSSTTKA